MCHIFLTPVLCVWLIAFVMYMWHLCTNGALILTEHLEQSHGNFIPTYLGHSHTGIRMIPFITGGTLNPLPACKLWHSKP